MEKWGAQDLRFQKFFKMRSSNFSNKKGDVGKIEDCFKKERGYYFFSHLTNPFKCHLCVWYVCLLLIYTISISIFCVLQEALRLIDLMSKHVAFIRE